MRKLRLVVAGPRYGVPVILLASLLPAGAIHCSNDVEVEGGATGSGQGGAGGSSTGVAGGGTGGIGLPDGGDPDAGVCTSWEWEETFEVAVPPEGVPAEPGQLCAAPFDPVESNRAAFVTLAVYSQAPHLVTGQVTVPPAVLAEVAGLPTIEVSEAANAELLGMQVSNVQSSPTGYTFHGEWPEPFTVRPDEWAGMTVRVSLPLACTTGPAKQVQSLTEIHLCIDVDGLAWVSSGEQCTACVQVCEMAPSPASHDAPHDALHDPLPLSRALGVSLRPLAKVGRARVVVAEHDGGDGLRYQWQASAGEVRQLAPDVVVWTPPRAGSHCLTVAVAGAGQAGVASLAVA